MRDAKWRVRARDPGLALSMAWTLAFAAGEPLETRMDERGPCLILATEAAAKAYGEAILEARRLHPGAAEGTFDPAAGFVRAKEAIGLHRPRYALVFLLPEELDARAGWDWLGTCAEVDADPFVDVRSGFVTGATPAAAAAFMRRIRAAVRGESKLPPVFVDNLGPNRMAPKGAVFRHRMSTMLPAYPRRLETVTISHAGGALDDPARAGLGGAGIVHLGGHGLPGGILDGVGAKAVAGLGLAPCVIFNGACYSGVTCGWLDVAAPQGLVRERTISPDESFCLQILETAAVGYLAALHPDHGIPVYQEMEYLAATGGSLGDAMKSTLDGIVIANGGRLPRFERLADGKPVPRWTPSELMLKGVASRILFGDPALVPFAAFARDPFEIACSATEKSLRISAKVQNPELVNLFTDTYHADLSSDATLFNARALLTTRLPEGWKSVSTVTVTLAEAARSLPEKLTNRPAPGLRHRVVGFAVEEDGEKRLLHAQVDLSSTGYRESPFLREGSVLELEATR